MTKAKFFSVALFVAAVGGIALVTAGPISAMPGWSDGGHSGMSISKQQRDQIRNLHSAYRSALSSLDWSVGENGHSAETMQKARELKIALHQEIMDVIHRGNAELSATPEDSCPYSGEAEPVQRLESNANTLYL